jgi:hypothetical protein
MKVFLLALTQCFSLYCIAQTDSYMISTEGEKIEIVGGKVEFSEDHISFSSPNEKKEYIRQSKVQLLVFGKEKYENLPIYGKVMRLHEVIAANNSYKLTQYWDDGVYYYIFDKDNVVVEGKIRYTKKSEQEIEMVVRKYFKDCKELLKQMQTNKSYKSDLFFNVHNFNCIVE